MNRFIYIARPGIFFKPVNHNHRINKVQLRQIRQQSIVILLFFAKAEKISYPCFLFLHL